MKDRCMSIHVSTRKLARSTAKTSKAYDRDFTMSNGFIERTADKHPDKIEVTRNERAQQLLVRRH